MQRAFFAPSHRIPRFTLCVLVDLSALRGINLPLHSSRGRRKDAVRRLQAQGREVGLRLRLGRDGRGGPRGLRGETERVGRDRRVAARSAWARVTESQCMCVSLSPSSGYVYYT